MALRPLATEADLDSALLTPDERILFDALTEPRRRREWFTGRMAARGALRAVGAGAASVLRAPNGAPTLEGPHAERALVAITHGRRTAGAVAARRDGPTPHIGLDLVDREDDPRVARIAERVLQPHERALMGRDARAGLLAWAAREAAAKATRTGMFAFALSDVHLRAIDEPPGTLTLSPPGFSSAYAATPDGGFMVFVSASDDAVENARAIAKQRNAPPDG